MIIEMKYPPAFSDMGKSRCQHTVDHGSVRKDNCKRFAMYDVNGLKLCKQHAGSFCLDQKLADNKRLVDDSKCMSVKSFEDKILLLKCLYDNANDIRPHYAQSEPTNQVISYQAFERLVSECRHMPCAVNRFVVSNAGKHRKLFDFEFIYSRAIMVDLDAEHTLDFTGYIYYNTRKALDNAISQYTRELEEMES